MLVLLFGGLFMTTRIKQEVFPEFNLDVVSVRVVYPGASPEEVEQGIVLAIEDAISGIAEIKQIRAVAGEGVGLVNAELRSGIDEQKAYQEIDQEVARIVTFPRDAEEPQIRLETERRLVRNLTIYGDVDEQVLRGLGEQVRDRLLQSPGITQVDLLGVPNYEIHIEIPQNVLRTYGLTLDEVARTVAASALELPGGSVKTEGGEILLRVKERRDWAREYMELPVVTTASGAVIRLGDIGEVLEGFEDVNIENRYNGMPSVDLGVFRVGSQTPLGVAGAMDDIIDEVVDLLPPGVDVAVTIDRAANYAQRLRLLMKNAFMGLILVLIVLGLFLEIRLAFWVTVGIPTSFLGALLFLPFFGVTINMMSMFAFIIALGIVVDDAIVAGENIYERRRQGMRLLPAAVKGAQEVFVPITFSIVTNIVAFLPLAFVPGFMGKVWFSIPMVVISVFVVSWVEALFILPAHLGHGADRTDNSREDILQKLRDGIAQRLQRFIDGPYARLLGYSIEHRWYTLAIGVVVLMIALAYATSGRMGFILMPRVEADQSVVTALLPYGTPIADVRRVTAAIAGAAERVISEHGGEQMASGVASSIDENRVEVTAFLTDPNTRPLDTFEFSRLWREATGVIPGLQMLRFEADRGGPRPGPALTVELSHRDIATLDLASADLGAELAEFSETKDIDDGYSPGKEQLDFRIRTAGRATGLTAESIARQVRAAFYGALAIRQQRGRNEVKVLVRLPREERIRESAVENLLVSTPAGTWVPLSEVASVERGRAYTAINRRDGRRTVQVTCNIEPYEHTSTVQTTLRKTVMPRLVANYPGLRYSFEGQQADQRDTMRALFRGGLLALVVVYALLAIPFRSYVQPLVVLIAVPFGMVGAILGHVVMGYGMSIISIMGIVALSGVVVNDSLILITEANEQEKVRSSCREAVVAAGMRRFRPILFTTLSTFGGLAPMIFETSRQARFMIPMALSLGYGIIFATVITLVLVPNLYLVVQNGVGAAKRFGVKVLDPVARS
jgi:multidrug efflux pump subunit AcrB